MKRITHLKPGEPIRVQNRIGNSQVKLLAFAGRVNRFTASEYSRIKEQLPGRTFLEEIN